MHSTGSGLSSRPGRTARFPLALSLALIGSGCGGAAPSGQPSADPGRTATPQPTVLTESASPFGIEDLDRIVVTAVNAPAGLTVDDELRGQEALEQPVALLPETTFTQQPGFVDARMTRLGTSGPGSYWEEGGYVTWAALYLAPGSAATAFAVLVEEHVIGWGMEEVGRPPFGDDGVTLEGPAYGFDTLLYVWRAGNLLLAVAGLGPRTTESELQSIAAATDARLNPLDLSDVVRPPQSRRRV